MALCSVWAGQQASVRSAALEGGGGGGGPDSAMKEDDAGGTPPQFLSTHPSYETRLANFDEWMPEAKAVYRGPDGRRCMRIREDMKRARAQAVTKRSGGS
mmetsp:Transcript_50111/g.98097  ORF Transcript_50111/g.98097 Transcript_50111/m.98097 type:complete len:100 (+) Transcript_50111:826-1125(+)